MGIEKRRVRFASIQGIGREDLPLAAEIWHQDLLHQIWTSREIIKLALLFTRYMANPNEELLKVGYIERSFNMDVRMTLDTLRQMEMFGAIEAHSIKDNALHVSLCLSLLQRVKVLETRTRFIELSGARSMNAFKGQAADRWEPPVMPKDQFAIDGFDCNATSADSHAEQALAPA